MTANPHPLDAAARDELAPRGLDLDSDVEEPHFWRCLCCALATDDYRTIEAHQLDTGHGFVADNHYAALVAAARRGAEDTAPNYEAAQREFHRVTAYWAPEWVSDSDMFAKMLDTVLAAARAHPEDATDASL